MGLMTLSVFVFCLLSIMSHCFSSYGNYVGQILTRVYRFWAKVKVFLPYLHRRSGDYLPGCELAERIKSHAVTVQSSSSFSGVHRTATLHRHCFDLQLLTEFHRKNHPITSVSTRKLHLGLFKVLTSDITGQ